MAVRVGEVRYEGNRSCGGVLAEEVRPVKHSQKLGSLKCSVDCSLTGRYIFTLR